MQTVVWEASMGHVRIPQNYPDENGWSWKHDPTGHVQQVYPQVPRYLKPGQIMQMHWRNQRTGNITPHTFLVWDNNWVDTVNVIESNWTPPYEEIVNTRPIPYDVMTQSLVYYSVYEIW